MYYETLISPLEKDPPPGEYVDYYIRSHILRIQWQLVAGEGTIKQDGVRCLFTAPGGERVVNPVLAGVYVPIWNSVKKDYSKQAILTIPLTISEDEYLVYTLDGTYQCKTGVALCLSYLIFQDLQIMQAVYFHKFV